MKNIKSLLNGPKWLNDKIHYLTIMGSSAYGVAENSSDIDIYGFVIPPNDILFPSKDKYIYGYNYPKAWEQYQEHHIKNTEATKEYDFSIYNLIKYIKLCKNCNPNMIDSLFVPEKCIIYQSRIGQYIRENRQLFLSKMCYDRFKGYAYSNVKKIGQQSNFSSNKRQKSFDNYGYDVKAGYHLVRLLLECEYILTNHNLVLDNNIDTLKDIRAGKWRKEKLLDWFEEKESTLKKLYDTSTLRDKPDETIIFNLLQEALEMRV